jgi:hypothetical protein
MTYIPDLTPCTYFHVDPEDRLLAVGWLERDQPYTKGDVDPEFTRALAALLCHPPWTRFSFRGFHDCNWRHSDQAAESSLSALLGALLGPTHAHLLSGHRGIYNLFVPGNKCVYVAPELILHYISAHGYSPPREFQKAVLACPKMLSVDHLKALIKAGPPALAEQAQVRLFCDKLGRFVVESLARSELVQQDDIEKATTVAVDRIELGWEWWKMDCLPENQRTSRPTS